MRGLFGVAATRAGIVVVFFSIGGGAAECSAQVEGSVAQTQIAASEHQGDLGSQRQSEDQEQQQGQGQKQDEVPEANPARPTVTNPATLTPVGYLQFESGFFGALDSGEFSSLYDFNEVMKLAVSSRLEFIANAQPATRYQSGFGAPWGDDAGDVLLGGQGVVHSGTGVKPVVAVSYLHRAYAGDAPDVDYGSPVNSLLILGSGDYKRLHYDTNFIFNEVEEAVVRRAQYGQTLSVTLKLTEKWSESDEIWRFTQPFLRGNAVGYLWAMGYEPRKNLVFDAGFDHGLTSTSTQWEFFGGFTYLVPRRLWRTREKK